MRTLCAFAVKTQALAAAGHGTLESATAPAMERAEQYQQTLTNIRLLPEDESDWDLTDTLHALPVRCPKLWCREKDGQTIAVIDVDSCGPAA